MPRKKSAAKKVRESAVQEDVPIQESLFEDQDGADDVGFKINEEYARRFEHNKKREDLHRLQEKYKGTNLEVDEEDDSTSEEEDDIGDLNTPQIDAAILKMLSKIRNKDPDLYTTEAKFFEEAEREAAIKKTRQAKPTRIADVHRETLLAGKGNAEYDGEDSDEEEHMAIQDSNTLTHVQEQDALRNAFHGIGDEADSDDDVLVPRKKTSEESKTEDEEYQRFLKEQLEDGKGEELLAQFKSGNPENPEGEEFLMNFVLNRGWIDKDADAVPSYDQIVDSDEEFADWEERAEKFETTYNFRFEQPGATEIVTHPRDIQSVRRKDEKRKKEREQKSLKEKSAKQERIEEINRLRNLKKAELEEKIKKIEEVTGRPMNFEEVDLEADFDPEAWDKKMIDQFNDEFYAESEKKPEWDDDIDIDDLNLARDDDAEEDYDDQEAVEGREDATATSVDQSAKSRSRSSTTGLTKREERSRKRKIEALVDASVPEALGPGGRRFRYRQTQSETFGLTVEDILFADDKQLNEYAGLKKLASFKPHDKMEHDRKKYGAKKRAKKFQKELWSQSRWAERATGGNDTELGSGGSAKKKQKKKNDKER